VKAKISLITLGVSDFERSLAFYRDGLGFPTHRYNSDETMVMFRLEGTWLGLFPRDKLAEDAGLPEEGHGFPGFSLAHNVASRDEVDGVFQAAIAAGASLVKPPQNAFWGGYSGYFADPDGFLWEVAYNPFTDLV
jgi:uncharacterized protein